MLYTDPNRVMKGDADFPQDEAAFAHDCGGARIEAAHRAGQYLTDPHSSALLRVWKNHVRRYVAAGNYDAVFEDDANTVAYSTGQPCRFDPQDWLAATVALQRALAFPVIYNGLNNFSDRTVSISIGLNRSAIGGMMEECYGSSPSQPETSGDQWFVAEKTELRMAQDRKLFFCYDNDTEPAAAAIQPRLFVLASFLLAYDPSTSILWEYFQGPSHFHVMPEVQLVPLEPRSAIRSVDQMRTASGLYERSYEACYLGGRLQGPCIVAVNPDRSAHPLALPGYRRTLVLSGAGILDGGTVRITAPAPPRELAPSSGVIAFR
jgi:hypothetical protein